MPEHFTKSTVEATFWCRKCGKPTPHQVWNGRRGSCLRCIERLEAESKAAKDASPPAPEQGNLFGEKE